ncbi:MAG: lipocalin family protein [Pseudomonadota bacterium]
MRFLSGLILIGALAVSACGGPTYRDTSVPMVTHGPVDLERYQGLWYEIARYPNSFEEGCFGVTAEYSLNEDGSVKVVNTCRQGALDGPEEVAEGRATSASAEGDKLEVGFVPWLPFAVGDYWILSVTDAYSVAVIGTPDGGFGWILAREPSLNDVELEAAYAVLRRNGYDPAALYLTPQVVP